MKRCLIFATFMALILLSTTLAYAVQSGVKPGDWIKLSVSATGGPSRPASTWMKVEFLIVTGTKVTARVTINVFGGKQNATVTYDLATGISTDGAGGTGSLAGLIIPAGSKVGDRIRGFQGNVTITGETARIYAWAIRTVLYGNFSAYGNQETIYWDKQTAVLVEASSKSGNITSLTVATETNMWPPELLYMLLAVIVVIVVVCAVLIVRRRRKRQPSKEVRTTSPTIPES
jgi:hypothetical protein